MKHSRPGLRVRGFSISAWISVFACPEWPLYTAISEFPKWRKYLILLSFLDNSSARPVQIGGVDVNICHSRSTAVRGRRRSSSQSPPRGPFCRTRTGPVEADGAVDAQNAPTAPWKTLCVFHELPQGLSHQVTHEKLRKAPKYRWETRIDPFIHPHRSVNGHISSSQAPLPIPSTRRRGAPTRRSSSGRRGQPRSRCSTAPRRASITHTPRLDEDRPGASQAGTDLLKRLSSAVNLVIQRG